MTEKLVQGSIYLSETTWRKLRERARYTGRNKSQTAERILAAGLEDAETALRSMQGLPNNPQARLDRAAEIARSHGPEIGLQALLLAAGAQLDTGRSVEIDHA